MIEEEIDLDDLDKYIETHKKPEKEIKMNNNNNNNNQELIDIFTKIKAIQNLQYH